MTSSSLSVEMPPDLAEESLFLKDLGEQVRNWRARRGMTRKILARDSGVSERYLAQLEAGKGNMSVMLLRQVANALGLPLAELVRDNGTEASELRQVTELLRRIPARRLGQVHSQLLHELRQSERERTQRIALIGLRGAGKSTVGARLADELAVRFIELDAEVEREAGTSLSEIFLMYGQGGYRRYERRALEHIIAEYPQAVIATGGSIVSEPGTFDLLLSSSYTVWLKANPEDHMARVLAQGDTRPMAGNREAMEDLRRILQGRGALYAQADLTVDTSFATVDACVHQIANALQTTQEA